MIDEGDIESETTGAETVVPPPVVVPPDVPPVVPPDVVVLPPVEEVLPLDALAVDPDELDELDDEPPLDVPPDDETAEEVDPELLPPPDFAGVTSTKLGLAAASSADISFVVPSGFKTITLSDLVKPRPPIVIPNILMMVITKLTPTNFFSHILFTLVYHFLTHCKFFTMNF